MAAEGGPMSNLIYLVIAAVLSVLGSLVLWLRHRQPSSMEAAMKQFSRELRALAPERPKRLDDSRQEVGQEHQAG
jgi:hypothetical protein